MHFHPLSPNADGGASEPGDAVEEIAHDPVLAGGASSGEVPT